MKLSVAMITYNHENYIAQAIESVLCQKTRFNFEIVIGEDCSSDKTRDIIFDYKRRYPGKIRLLLHKRNVGMNRNFIFTIDNCRGKYVAYLEGDDYWISPDKLQKQVDLLEKNKNSYAFSFHLVKKEYTNNVSQNEFIPDEKKRKNLTFNDFLPYDCTHLSSLVFLKNKIKEWPPFMFKVKMMDWPFRLLLLEGGGEAVYLNEVMSVYRVHGRGMHSRDSLLDNYLKSLEALRYFKKYFDKKYRKRINFSIYLHSALSAAEYYKQKKYSFLLITTIKIIGMRFFRFFYMAVNSEYKSYWFDFILNDIYKKTNFAGKLIIKLFFLVRNFLILISKEGILNTIKIVCRYIFNKKRGYLSSKL